MNLLNRDRIAFYSTPGIDGGEKRTNGFNPITPRLFEVLSAGCHVLARYPQNIETEFFELESICPSINSYDEFRRQISTALKSPQPIRRNSEYLRSHYTSSRLEIINGLI